MTIRHHLTDQMLMAYAAGELPEAFSLVVATHVSLCDECRARLASFEALGGALVEAAGTAALRDDCLDAVLARLDVAGQMPRPKPPAPGVFPAPLRDYVGGDLAAVRWRPVGMGVKQAILRTGDSATVRLLHIAAGTTVPDHGHRGIEMTLVLKGAFRDGHDRFARGDVEIAGSDVEHTPVAEDGEDCVCLAATDAPLRFSRLIPRLAQPFLRI